MLPCCHRSLGKVTRPGQIRASEKENKSVERGKMKRGCQQDSFCRRPAVIVESIPNLFNYIWECRIEWPLGGIRSYGFSIKLDKMGRLWGSIRFLPAVCVLCDSATRMCLPNVRQPKHNIPSGARVFTRSCFLSRTLGDKQRRTEQLARSGAGKKNEPEAGALIGTAAGIDSCPQNSKRRVRESAWRERKSHECFLPTS